MGVPTSEVGYTSAKTGRGDHEVHKGHVMALEKKNVKQTLHFPLTCYLFVSSKLELAMKA
jgi:hypothetical protein